MDKTRRDLTTCAADSDIPQAENAIRFVKERRRCIQYETPFKKYQKRLMIEMVKRVTVLINLFKRKSGLHPMMSPRQLIFGRNSRLHYTKLAN